MTNYKREVCNTHLVQKKGLCNDIYERTYLGKFCETKLDCKPKAYLKPCKCNAALASWGNFRSRAFFYAKDKKVCKVTMSAEGNTT